jgi:hypothetical protein
MFHRVLRSGNEEDEHFGSRIVASTMTAVKTDVLVRASYPEDAMRLSEAIRLGAMMTPQARGALLTNEGVSALGAALSAIGVALDNVDIDPVGVRWPWLKSDVDCPQCDPRGLCLVPRSCI